ncbi:MAG: hypothetical protein M3680_14090 [Myxococcota bacterium]|nr:hypothetical protein [Myxococcota bacterium]
MEDELKARGINGKPHVQGSATHSQTPGDVDVEILVEAKHFEELGKRFLHQAPEGSAQKELAISIRKQKIPSYQFYPDQAPSVADTVRKFTGGPDAKTLEVQATLITRGSDFDLGPHL